MKTFSVRLVLLSLVATARVWAQEEAAAAAASTATKPAAAATVKGNAAEDFLEYLVDRLLHAMGVDSSGNTTTHLLIAAGLLVGAFLFRHVVTKVFFAVFRKMAAKTQTTLDDKLFRALEGPVALLIVIIGGFGAAKVLKLSPAVDHVVSTVATLGFSFAIFWLFLRAFNTVLDHVAEVARQKELGIAAFMPWIKKSLLTLFFIFGVLMVAQSLGADVKAFLTGLGIGGLAFALAAQDTIANVFGSVVIAVDHPCKVGDTVQVAGYTGTVEEIGLRSTRIRMVDRAFLTIPNKTMAAEPIVNLSHFTERRVEQVLGLTYDTSAEKMAGLVEDIRALLKAEVEIDDTASHVYFRDFNASSMDVWMVYLIKDADFAKHMALRQKMNLAFIRAIEARGLAFAFPTQTVMLDGAVAKRLAGEKV